MHPRNWARSLKSLHGCGSKPKVPLLGWLITSHYMVCFLRLLGLHLSSPGYVRLGLWPSGDLAELLDGGRRAGSCGSKVLRTSAATNGDRVKKRLTHKTKTVWQKEKWRKHNNSAVPRGFLFDPLATQFIACHGSVTLFSFFSSPSHATRDLVRIRTSSQIQNSSKFQHFSLYPWNPAHPTYGDDIFCCSKFVDDC